MKLRDPGTQLDPVVKRTEFNDREVLALRGEHGAYGLHVWNPRTGADRALTWKAGPVDGICNAQAWGRTADGRILVRNIAMAFDAYLSQQQESDKPLFSKTV